MNRVFIQDSAYKNHGYGGESVFCFSSHNLHCDIRYVYM